MLRTLLLALTLPALLPAALTRIEITERSPILNGKSFGQAGPYERIIGIAHFAADPAKNPNVVNLHTPAEYFADFVIFAPVNPARSNGTLLFEVSNRGRKSLLRGFNLATESNDPRTPAEFGDGYLLEQGYLLVWLGWQFDVPREKPLMSVTVPIAKNPDGSPISGLVRSDFVPDGPQTRFSLADRLFHPYKVANPADPANVLTERTLADGPARIVPRSQWRFTPDGGAIEKPTGFESGHIYEVVYRSQDPPIIGLGMAGIRDFISALKSGATPLQSFQPAARRTLAFGSSQSGRFLRTFLYQGFNRDEQGNQVFDGVWAHVAGGGRGSFNHQFAQPSRDARPYFNFHYPTDIFPFTDLPQTDPITNQTAGILTRAQQQNVVPKIFYTNTAYEYYGRAASLMHTTVDGEDAPLAPATRLYVYAGANHVSGAIPPAKTATTRYLNTGNDYNWFQRGLLSAMNRWLTDNTEPPPSVYPTVAKGELVPLAKVNFLKRPATPTPTRIHEVHRLDFGPDFATKGIVTNEPPKLGPKYPVLVPQADPDGNDIGGLKTPQLAVPLATHTGWNLRAPGIGSPEELFSMVGSYFPFAPAAVTKRYQTKQNYLKQVNQAAKRLAEQGYILPADIPNIEALSAREWDYVMSARAN